MFMGLVSITTAVVSIILIVKLATTVQKNRQYLNRLHDIDRSILSGLSHRGVMYAIMDKLTSIIKPDGVAILKVDKQSRLKTVISDHLSKKFNETVDT